MKKLLLLISAVMVAVTLSAGDSLQDKGVFSDWKFAPLQLGLGVKNWRNLVDNQTDTVFSLVLCSMSQKSAVISLCAVGGVFNNYGISIAGINGSKENYGIKIGLINYKDFFEYVQILGINIVDTVQIGLTNDMGTVQIGLLNGRGCVQIGLWNYCPGSYIPYFPLINFDMGKKE
ncbi:MAG: hypothetical protein IJV89_05750 [Lentisphaeria bacterium]|nr:hypothetical protein [Lentisphaeria bacterium]